VADIPWTWLAIRGSGVTAWGLLTAVVLWGILLRTQVLGRLAAPMRLLDLHRWLGAVALGFLLLHMGLLLIDPAVSFTLAQILVPGMAPWQTLAVALGSLAFWLLFPVSFLGRLRAKMGLAGNRWFKRTHLLGYAAWPLATAHYVLAGTDALAEWSLGILFAGTGLIVLALLARGFVPAPGPTRPVRGDLPAPLTSA
jgi:predicted ferric reductase